MKKLEVCLFRNHYLNLPVLTLDQDIVPANNEFNTLFLDLLRRIFVYNPRKRITAAQALQHPWFRELLQDDGTEALKIRKANERKRFDSHS